MTNRLTVSARAARARAALLATLLLVLGTAGCGDLTAGGISGEATVVVTGDLDTPAPAASSVQAAASARSPSAPATAVASVRAPSRSSHDEGEEADEAEGEVEARFMLFLVSETGATLQLGGDEIRVRVDVQGRNEADVVTEAVPVGTYVALQIVFTEIKAEIDRGLLIGGVPVTGEIRVELEDLTLPVSRPITLEVRSGRSVELVVDLNAPAWLLAVDPTTGRVDPSVFGDIINVEVRGP